MDFELTISGLCVVAIQSSGDPTAPAAVDILCPKAHCHRARLNFNFAEVQRAKNPPVEPEMVIDPSGARFGSLDLRDRFLTIDFTSTPYDAFVVQRGPADSTTPPSEKWLNWVPTLEEIGFETFKLGSDKPHGALARISLPKGELECRKVVRDADTQKFALWEFPAVIDKATGKPIRKAIANEIVFRAASVGDLLICDQEGRRVLTAERPEGTTLKMSISNDLHALTVDTPMETTVLEHLKHVESLAEPARFLAPRLADEQRTGAGPICSQVINNYDDK